MTQRAAGHTGSWRTVARARLALPLSALLLASPAAAAGSELVLLPDWRLLTLLLALFAVMVPIINALVLRPVLRVLEERDARIAGTRRRGERLAREGSEVLARYERAVREARETAERARKQRVSEARARTAEELAAARAGAEQELDRARREVGEALGEARDTLRAQARTLGREAAASVLGRPLS